MGISQITQKWCSKLFSHSMKKEGQRDPVSHEIVYWLFPKFQKILKLLKSHSFDLKAIKWHF